MGAGVVTDLGVRGPPVGMNIGAALISTVAKEPFGGRGLRDGIKGPPLAKDACGKTGTTSGLGTLTISISMAPEACLGGTGSAGLLNQVA